VTRERMENGLTAYRIVDGVATEPTIKQAA
jgi:hypothetical protein